MEKQDKTFIITFLLTLTLLVFLLRGTITGHVVQTSYCDDTDCYEFCTKESDCGFTEKCCQERDFGICKEDCEKEYVFSPEINMDSLPRLEQPAQVKSNNILYLFLIFVTLIIGGSYFFLRNKHIHIKY